MPGGIENDICKLFSGRFVAGVVRLRDITHEIEEKQLSEKGMKLRFEFFSYIVHEFKTPLTVINAEIEFSNIYL